MAFLCLRPWHTTQLSNSSIMISRHTCTTGHVEGQYLKFQGILLKTPVVCGAILESEYQTENRMWHTLILYKYMSTQSPHTHIYIDIYIYKYTYMAHTCIQYVFMCLQLRCQTCLFCFRTVLPWHDILLCSSCHRLLNNLSTSSGFQNSELTRSFPTMSHPT